MADSQRSLAERLLAGDKRALARGISLVEDDDPEGWELVREIYPHTGSASVVGFTGPPGAGKSTLIGALVANRRAAGRQVAVLSIDPSSPFRGGALLGDRIRLSEHFLDPGVFIRSMATRGALGGLAEAALQTALLMDAAGRDDVFLETVGVGQAEVDVIDHADTVVLVLIPGSGDSIQALKAGVMEIPDVIVVNKADHPLTDTMVREIKGVLTLAPQGDWPVPIVKTEAHRGEGDRGAGGQARRAPRARRGAGHAVRAPAPQPAERGARAWPRCACGARSRRRCTRTRGAELLDEGWPGAWIPPRPRADPRPRGRRAARRRRADHALRRAGPGVAAVAAAALAIDDRHSSASRGARNRPPTTTPTPTPTPPAPRPPATSRRRAARHGIQAQRGPRHRDLRRAGRPRRRRGPATSWSPPARSRCRE
jgi:LAO/AO transport system kinase